VKTRSEFAREIARLDLTSVECAIALLWYYRETQQFEDRTAIELATDLGEEGFRRPNVTRLHEGLSDSRDTVRGQRERSFQIALRQLDYLNERYGPLASLNRVQVDDTVLPAAWVKGTRAYLERLVHQINGSYQYGFNDGCAALCRRLMESLIVEIYIHQQRQAAIQLNGKFFMLERLIATVRNDTAVTLGRNTPKTMDEIKSLGDTAAHDRTYITEPMDIDEVRARYRRMIRELLDLAGIVATP
jgi:hypothetical protein